MIDKRLNNKDFTAKYNVVVVAVNEERWCINKKKTLKCLSNFQIVCLNKKKDGSSGIYSRKKSMKCRLCDGKKRRNNFEFIFLSSDAEFNTEFLIGSRPDIARKCSIPFFK